VLHGTYGSKRNGFHDMEARPHVNAAAVAVKAPDIGGVWDIPTESPKGEHAWRLIIRQTGADVSAAILRVDGDTGAIVGKYQDGRFVLNHFDGARAYVLDITPRENGTLTLTLKGAHSPLKSFTAVRQLEARAKGLPEPTDPDKHTHLKNPAEPLAFSFPDVDGKLVSNTDDQFKSKVVIVNITGSWCPNCHDEAPFLAELYRRYHSLGLEIVALDFEEPEQLADKTRLRAFIKKYGIGYTYLVAGEPKELQAKLPQAENLNSWPTTFFLGRDGKVRVIHAGFAAAASGEFHAQLKHEVTATVEQLLAEPTGVTQTAVVE
jgi:thiol-disulfide isomerase/thioredoxin